MTVDATLATVGSLLVVAAVVLFVPAPFSGSAILPNPSLVDGVIVCIVAGLVVLPVVLE